MKARPFVRRALAVCVVASACVVGFVAAPAQATISVTPSPGATQAVTNEDRAVIISVPAGKLDALVSFLSSLRLSTNYQYRYALNGVALNASPGKLALIQQAFPEATLSDQITYQPADTQLNAPWNLSMLDQQTLPADTEYNYPESAGEGVKVYVIDTGVAPNATQFGSRLAPGWDFTSYGSTGDCDGHGTHVAGTIGSRDYGVAKKVTIVPMRAIGGPRGASCVTTGNTENVIAAIDKAIEDNPAGKRAVINMSLGSTSPSGTDDQMDAAVARARADGIVVVVAAGNSAASPWLVREGGDGRIHGDACEYSPSNSPGTITVGAVNGAGVEASFSNFGRCVDVYAPGVNIRSIDKDNPAGSTAMSGTSMASPHVAGAVALYVAEHPTETVPTIVTNVLAAGRRGAVTMWPGSASPQYTPAHTNNPNVLLNIDSLLTPPTNRALPAVTIFSNPGVNGKPRYVPGGASTTLSTTKGSWNGGKGTTSFSWFRCSGQVVAQIQRPSGCETITSSHSQTYTVTRNDVDHFVTSSVTFTNGQGSVTAWAAAPVAVRSVPTVLRRPALTAGSPRVGKTLGVVAGSWSGTPTPTKTYQWFACPSQVRATVYSVPRSCSKIVGAQRSSIVPTRTMVGQYLFVTETAANDLTRGIVTYSKTTGVVRR